MFHSIVSIILTEPLEWPYLHLSVPISLPKSLEWPLTSTSQSPSLCSKSLEWPYLHLSVPISLPKALEWPLTSKKHQRWKTARLYEASLPCLWEFWTCGALLWQFWAVMSCLCLWVFRSCSRWLGTGLGSVHGCGSKMESLISFKRWATNHKFLLVPQCCR